jgi:carbon storage regulator
MLVLSRKRNEKIQIGNNVVITVVEILGDRVRIGIDAPEVVPIVRAELSKQWRDARKKKENHDGNGLERPTA